MLLANFNRKEHLRHRAVSLRQHGFLVSISQRSLTVKSASSAYLLYASLEATMYAGQSGYFVEVAVSSDEEVHRQSKLCEGALGQAKYNWLIIDLKSTSTTLSRETHRVPRVQRHWVNASAFTDHSHHNIHSILVIFTCRSI